MLIQSVSNIARKVPTMRDEGKAIRVSKVEWMSLQHRQMLRLSGQHDKTE